MKSFYKLLYLILASFFLLSSLSFTQDSYNFTFQGKKYEIVKQKKSWVAAASYAVDKGGYLVHINSKEEQNAMYSAIQQANISTTYTVVYDGGGIAYIWIGATDRSQEGSWIWDGNNDAEGDNFWNGQGNAGKGDGSVVKGSYANWGGSSFNTYMEPDDFSKSQDAAAIGLEAWPKGMGGYGVAGEWNDIKETNEIFFIIEYDEKAGTPSLISPDNNSIITTQKPKFSWNSVSCDFYQIQLSLLPDFAGQIVIDEINIKDTFYLIKSNLSFDNTYYWRIRANKDNAYGDWSSIRNIRVKKDLNPQKTLLISPLDKAEIVSLKPKFHWSKGNSDSYILHVSMKEDFSETVIDQTLNDSSYTALVDLINGSSYFWRVKGIIGTKESDWSDTWSFKVLPQKPAKTLLSEPKNNSVDVPVFASFKFNLDNNATFYKLIISKNADLSNPEINLQINAEGDKNTVTIDKPLSNNTTYFWAMLAGNSAGEGQLSDIWKFTTAGINSVEDIFSDILVIFPNPAKDILYLKLNSKIAVNIEISNLLGEIVFQDKCQIINESIELNIHDLVSGCFLISVKDSKSQKLISKNLFIKR